MQQILNLTKIQKAYWALAAISFFWGTTWFVSKLALKHIPPLQMTGIRQSAAGILLIGYFLLKKRPIPSLNELGFHLLMGFLLISCSNGLTTWAVAYIPSYLGALISCLMPFVMVIVNFAVFRESIKPMAVFGLVVGFAGVAILLSSFIEELGGDHFLFGVILTLMGVATWTTGTLITSKNRRKINAFEGIGWQMLFGGIILYIASLLTGQHVAFSEIPFQTWMLIVYLTAVGSIFCFLCYLYTLIHLPIDLVTVYVYINPLVALLMGVVLLNEKITVSIVIGALTIIAGIYLVKRFSKQ